MDSDSSDEEMFAPVPTPGNRRGQLGTISTTPPPLLASASLPVQLTWKGVQIYFPSVVLKSELKTIADEALAKRSAGEPFKIPISTVSSPASPSSSSTSTTRDSSKKPSWKIKAPAGKLSKAKAKTKPGSTNLEENATPNQPTSNQCKICHCVFHSSFALSRHSPAHTDTVDRKYGPCKCGAKYSRREHLKRHEKICVVANPSRTSESGIEASSSNEQNDSLIRLKMESVEDLSKLTEESNQTNTTFEVSPSGNDFDEDENGQIPVVTSVSSIASNALTCERCGSQFVLGVQFKHHQRFCENMCKSVDKKGLERKFHCEFCPWKFSRLQQLDRHRNFHDGKRPFQCPSCLETFARKDYLTKHQTNCIFTIDSPTTSTAVAQEVSMSSTINSNDNDNDPETTIPTTDDSFDCSDNNEVSEPKESEDTSSSGQVKNAFSIIMQGSSSSSKPKPTNFPVRLTSSGVECKICNRKFSSIPYLRKHVCHRKIKSKESISCPYCGVVITVHSLRRHLRNIHKCPKCADDFQQVDERMRHVSDCIQTELSDELYSKFKCFICHECFPPMELVRHMSLHKDNNDQAGTSFANESGPSTTTSVHLPSTADEVMCDSQSKLDVNEPGTSSTTSASAPPPMLFTCKFSSCTRFFSHDEDLWFHISLKHKSVGNICCGQCGQDFKTEKLVNEHEQIAHAHVEQQSQEIISPTTNQNPCPTTSSELNPSSPRPKSPLSILSMDIARVMETESPNTSPLKSAPPVNISKKKNPFPLLTSVFSSMPVSVFQAAVKKENEEIQEEEDQNYHDDNSHFDDNFDAEAQPDPEPESLIPETRKMIESSASNPNPYVFITAECKAIADEALKKAVSTACDSFFNNSIAQESSSSSTINPLYHTPPVLHDLDSYSCSLCPDSRRFERNAYIQHLREEHKQHPETFTCHVCAVAGVTKTFNNRHAYCLHLKYHRHRQNSIPGTSVPVADEYFCKICHDRKFIDRRLYLVHMKYHLKQKEARGFDKPIDKLRRTDVPVQEKYTCSQCHDRTFTDRLAYFRHLNYHAKLTQLGHRIGRRRGTWGFRRNDIPTQAEYTCAECDDDRTFTDRKTYICHLNYHKRSRDEQEKKARRASNLRPDIPISLTGEYTCSTCHDRSFDDRFTYLLHVKYHEQIVEREGQDRPIATVQDKKRSSLLRKDIPFADTYTCATCNDREFSDRTVYINHVNYHELLKKRGEDRPVAVIPCGANGHLLRPDIPVSDEYTCDLCEDKKIFKDRTEYLSHLNYHKRLQQKSFKSTHWRRQAGLSSWKDTIPLSDAYKCETCPGRTFNNRESYMGHIAYHDILKKKGCNRAIMTKEEWMQNKERVKITIPDGKFSYECEICNDGRTFSSRPSYISHLMYHEKLKRMGIDRPLHKKWEGRPRQDQDDGPPYTCSICDNRSFPTRAQYVGHLNYHKIIRNRIGVDRPINSDWRENRNSLLSKIPDLDEYTCEICSDGRTFSTKLSYYAHISYHRKREQSGVSGPLRKRGAYLREDIPIQDVYACTRCLDPVPRTFDDRRVFISHINYHDMRGRQAQGTSSGSREPIRRRKRKASFDPPYQNVYLCKYCIHLNKTFTDRQKYIAHMAYHKRNETLKSTFTSPSASTPPENQMAINAGTHLMNALTGRRTSATTESAPIDPEDKFYCTLCGSDTVFTCRDAYDKHKKEHRAMKKKAFQCSICEKAFSNIWNLKNHAKMHTGEKNYMCGDCGKRFITDNMLQQHQNKNCKKVQCKYTCHCGDKFHSVNSLEVHVKKNHIDGSVSRIFRCYVCNDQFLQAFELDQHVKESHPVDYAEFMQQKTEKARLEAGGEEPMQVEAGEEEDEPIYPEVLMGCQSDNEDDGCYTGGENLEVGSPLGNYNNVEASATTSPSNNIEETICDADAGDAAGGSWNFIPGLTGDTVSSNEEDEESNDSDDDGEEPIDPNYFEPEDVDVPVSTLVETYPHLSLTIARDQTSSPGQNRAKPRRKTQPGSDQDEDWTPSPQDPASSGAFSTKFKRTYYDNGSYQCCYCDKVCNRIAYIKMHSNRVHPNLPLKIITLGTEKKVDDTSSVAQKNLRKTLAKRYNVPTGINITKAPSTSTSIHPAKPFRYVHPQQTPVATISPLTHPVSQPPTSTITSITGGRRSSSDGNKQRPPPICDCAFEDTALGLQKRCTGETCACYKRYKGCSDKCDCKRSCGNPYRSPVPPTSLENTITLSSGANLQGGETVESGLSGSAPASRTLESLVHGLIENMMSGKARPGAYRITSSALTSDPNGPPQQSSYIEQEQQTRTLGNVTGYANSVSYETCNTSMGSGGNISNVYPHLSATMCSTSNHVANVPPSQTFGVGGNYSVNNAGTFSTTASNPTYSATSNQFSIPIPSISQLRGNQNPGQFQFPSSQSTSTFQNQTQFSDTCRIYRCFCLQDFDNLASFLVHQYHHKDEKLFLCPICKKQFATVTHLIIHARNHTEIETITLLPCFACDRLMLNKSELDRHFTTNHPTLICGVCDKYCSNAADLASHRLTHGVCNICGLSFFNQASMRHHLARDHPGSNAGILPLASTSSSPSSLSNFSDTRVQLLSAATSTVSGGYEPEVITLIDLEDEEGRPPSPEVPQIVSVTGTTHGNAFQGSGRSQEFGYFGFNT